MGIDDYIASIGMTASAYPPENTALCWGQQMAINQNIALYSLIGITYGGNGVTIFSLPNLQGGVPVGAGVQPGTGTNYDESEVITTLTQSTWSDGYPSKANPAGATPADTPTVPITSGVQGLVLNYTICLEGLWPSRS